MELKKVVSKLTQFAPLKLAEKWDNVGLLVEPSQPKNIERIFLTNDLTEKVMEEAVETKANMILSYHPPIFTALKKLTQASVKERIIVKAIEERIAIYSPHTTYDSVKGGVNDWLASGLGKGKTEIIQPFQDEKLKLVVFVPQDSAEKIRNAIAKAGAGVIGNYTHCTFSIPGTGTFLGNESSNPTIGKKSELETVQELRIEAVCNKSDMSNVVNSIIANHPYETPAYDFYKIESSDVEGTGQGRTVTLDEKISFVELVNRVKKHLQLDHVRVATPIAKEEVQVKKIALCAGSGSTVIGRERADVYLTGEMGHHDVLAAVEKGTSVILCEHSNTERGFLKDLKTKLEEMFEGKIDIVVSKNDKDPLSVF